MSTADADGGQDALARAIESLANEAFLAPFAKGFAPAPEPPAVADPPVPYAVASPSLPSTSQLSWVPVGSAGPLDPLGLPTTLPASAPSSPSLHGAPLGSMPTHASPLGGMAATPAGSSPPALPGGVPPSASSPTLAGMPPHPSAPPMAATPTDVASRGSDEPYFMTIAGMPGASPVSSREAAQSFSYAPENDRVVSVPRGIFDPISIKRDFPILHQRVNGKPLVWLDNAATTQKPRAVIDRLAKFYEHENSNVHRAAHTLAARATDAYEGARNTVKKFINAPSSKDIVFVRGATEAINLVAQSWGRRNIKEGDEIVVTNLEHHANIVPWQRLCAEVGARLKVAPVNDRGELIVEEFEKLFTPRTRIAAFTQVSNALGTILPAKQLVDIAHRHGAKVLLDGAQAVSHMPVDVQDLDCDFYVFSGHKIFAPTGIGVLFGKADILENMPPWQGGGNMIADVTFEKTVYQPPPWRFEAGTGNIADAVGLGAALDYLSELGLQNVGDYEHGLRLYGEMCLSRIDGVRIIGTAHEKAGVISFVIDGVKTEEVGGMLDQEGIAVRSGHHCAQPILRRFGLEATVRASLAPYNTKDDLDALAAAVRRIARRPLSG